MTDRTERAGLRECPFCGGKPVVEKRSGSSLIWTPWYREQVKCRKCRTSTRVHTKPGNAIAAWNRRPTEALAGKGGGDA